MEFSKINIITGHYGSGKTNISVNIALDLARQGEKVTVVDLDIVNPYFRTADFGELFKENGIALTVPMYANSNLDIPAIDFDLLSISDRDGKIIIDVGGDDEGAKALGRYRHILSKANAKMFYVVNCYRYLTKEPAEALALMRDIENASGLECSCIINNSNLGSDTDAKALLNSICYADEIANAAGLPIEAVCAKAELLKEAGIKENAYPTEIFVKKLWEDFA